MNPFRTVPVRFASTDVVEWPMGEVEMELDGQRMPVLTLFGAPDAPALPGAHALEASLLMADPVAKKLVRSEAHLMTACRCDPKVRPASAILPAWERFAIRSA